MDFFDWLPGQFINDEPANDDQYEALLYDSGSGVNWNDYYSTPNVSKNHKSNIDLVEQD